MKKIFVFFAIVALISPVFAQNTAATKPAAKLPDIYVFESPHCGACVALLMGFLPEMQKKYDKKVTWVLIDTSKPAGLSMLFRINDIHKRKNPVTPSILVGSVFLSGTSEIKATLELTIKDLLSGKLKALQPYSWQDFASMNTLMFFFKKIKVWTVAITGLVDGVNPCAFAVIAFFLCFLTIYGYRRREIFFVGIAYCAAIFFTYIFMGMGFFEILYRFPPFQNLRYIFYYMVSGFCFSVFLLSIYDFIQFQQSGNAGSVTLQLPKFLRRNIRHSVGTELRDEKGRNAISLMAVSFFIGILVAFLEGSCTAQLYFPAAAFISQSVKIRMQAFGYLFLYNIMFILPLIFIFGLSLWAESLQGVNNFLQKHIGSVKIAIALVFLAMGIIIPFL